MQTVDEHRSPAPAAGAAGLHPLAPFTALAQHRRLIGKLAWREIAARYRGARFGLFWTLLSPLFLLALYTFVFGTIFRMKWGLQGGSDGDFATLAFAGLIAHGFLAECIGRAPTLVVTNAIYVKRVVFPLEVLAWVTVAAALFHFAVNLVVLLGFVLFTTGRIPLTALLAPLVLAPLALLSLGATWLLAAVGVFLRDIGQVVGLAVTLLLFLAPVFYPRSAVPAEYRAIIDWNPLTPTIEQLRAVTIFGAMPNWGDLGLLLALGVAVAVLGLYAFQRARPGFADVL